MTITVNGSGFVGSSVVQWNGSSRVTTLLSSTQLQATITAADLASNGTAQITVFTPSPGGGTTSPISFTVDNPTPAITSLSPSNLTTLSVGSTLTVNGTGFVPSSVLTWTGKPHSFTFVSATQLQVGVAAADVATIGSAQIQVANAAPGGGTSAATPLPINIQHRRSAASHRMASCSAAARLRSR